MCLFHRAGLRKVTVERVYSFCSKVYCYCVASGALAYFAPSLALKSRETSVKHCNSKVFQLIVEWIQGQDILLWSNTNLRRFWYPGDTPDQQRRNPQQGIQIQDTWRTTTMPMTTVESLLRFKSPIRRRLSSGSLHNLMRLAIITPARLRAWKSSTKTVGEDYLETNDTQFSRRMLPISRSC